MTMPNGRTLADYTGDALSPAFNWANPTAYSASLLTKPLDGLREWWYQRPLAQFFDLARQFRSIESYNTLAARVFGIEFASDEIDAFRRTQSTLSQMFTRKGAPAATGSTE